MPSTISVTTKEIAGNVNEEAYVLGVQNNTDGNAALYRMRLSDIRGSAQSDSYIVPMLLQQYPAPSAFRMFVQGNCENAENPDIGAIVDRFYRAAANAVNETYASSFYLYNTSNSAIGTKGNDNAELVCSPSTNATATQDDYRNLALFMCWDCNYLIDPNTLEPVILAIKDVVGDYSAAPADSLVGVVQMTGWVKREIVDTQKVVSYRGQKTVGYSPLPEAVRYTDNSVRGYVLHAKYAAGYNSGGKLSSVSGVQPTTLRPGSAGSASISHDGQIALWRQLGNQHCGSALCDIAFLQLMLEIKYARLGSADIMQGCRSYYYAYAATVGETGVKRVLITTANGATLVVGSRVSVGTASDRAAVTAYDVCDIATILSIETVNVGGTDYAAVNLDSASTFNTTAGVFLNTNPWKTGATDVVLGNDGSPFSNTNGKEPFKIQGIEVMLGMYEVPADTIVTGNGTDAYNVFTCRHAASLASGKAGVGAVNIGTIPNANNAANAWKYTAELNWQNNQEAYMLQKQDNAASSNGYKSAFYKVPSTSTSSYEWMAFGCLYNGANCSIACAGLNSSLSFANWYFGARASGSGGNRGEYPAAYAAG